MGSTLFFTIFYLEGYTNKNDAKEREEKIKQFGKVYA